MRAVIQRVTRANVSVDGAVVGAIQRGLVVLLGVEQGDSDADLSYTFEKTIGLRIFNDQTGKMNRSVIDVGGQLLVISQFTLLGDVRKGRRPSFVDAAEPVLAKQVYERFVLLGQSRGVDVQTGIFQAEMQVELVNDGPVTIVVDSRKRI